MLCKIADTSKWLAAIYWGLQFHHRLGYTWEYKYWSWKTQLKYVSVGGTCYKSKIHLYFFYLFVRWGGRDRERETEMGGEREREHPCVPAPLYSSLRAHAEFGGQPAGSWFEVVRRTRSHPHQMSHRVCQYLFSQLCSFIMATASKTALCTDACCIPYSGPHPFQSFSVSRAVVHPPVLPPVTPVIHLPVSGRSVRCTPG